MNSVNPTPAATTSMENDTPEADDNCPICRNSFNGREVKPEIVKTRCGHRYDEDCITQWFNRQSLNSYSCCYCTQPPLPLQRESGARLYEQSLFCEAKPMQICRNGDDLDALQEMLKSEPSIADYEFRSAKTGTVVKLLYIAAQHGHLGHMEALIAKGADPNAEFRKARTTPLYVASEKGHIQIVKRLLKAGAKVDTQHPVYLTTALWIAASNGHTEIVKELIKADANVNISNKNGMTPLEIAAYNGHTDCVEALKPLSTDTSHPVTSSPGLQRTCIIA